MDCSVFDISPQTVTNMALLEQIGHLNQKCMRIQEVLEQTTICFHDLWEDILATTTKSNNDLCRQIVKLMDEVERLQKKQPKGKKKNV